MYPSNWPASDRAFTEAIEIAAGVASGNVADAVAAFRSALVAEGRSDAEIEAAMTELDDAIKDDSAHRDSEIWECVNGKLPTPQGDENQDQANARTCRTLHKLRERMPPQGTPLGDWAREPGRILQIGEQEE